MPLSPKNTILKEKILAGIEEAHQELLERSARNNETLVVSVNGVTQHVPAKDILEEKKRNRMRK
ncbi:MAG: hypothetical protein ABI729_10475 [Chitinophagales bacterium]